MEDTQSEELNVSMSHIAKLLPNVLKKTVLGLVSFAELTKPLIFVMVVPSQPKPVLVTVCK